MQIICDTHILLFWVDRKDRLSTVSITAIETSLAERELACSDVSFWEIAMLFNQRRLNKPAGVSPQLYMEDIVKTMALTVLPITPRIAHQAGNYFTSASNLQYFALVDLL